MRWHLCFNDLIDKQSQEASVLISEKFKSQYGSTLSFGNTVHDNDITRALVDFLAGQLIGRKHKCLIDTLVKLWD